MKWLGLRLLPYLIALGAGGALYAATVLYIRDEGLSGLLVNVASGLLSVPIVFIGYEIVKAACDRRLNNALLAHVYFDLDAAVIELLSALRRLVDVGELNAENLETLSKMPRNALRRHVRPDVALAPFFARAKASLAEVAHGRGAARDVLPNDELRLAMDMARQAGMVGVELSHPCAEGGDAGLLSALDDLLDRVDQWVEIRGDALFTHHGFRFVNTPPGPSDATTPS